MNEEGLLIRGRDIDYPPPAAPPPFNYRFLVRFPHQCPRGIIPQQRPRAKHSFTALQRQAVDVHLLKHFHFYVALYVYSTTFQRKMYSFFFFSITLSDSII